MTVQQLVGQHQRWVEVDHCHPCRLVWFDPQELSSITQAGWVDLLLAMVAPARPHATPLSELRAHSKCPRCSLDLRALHNQTRHGRFAGHECPNGHGQAQREAALLASRGLFRPLLIGERAALASEARELACQQCGAALDGGSSSCGYCQSALTVVDVPRLSQALGLGKEADAPMPARSSRIQRQAPFTAPVHIWPCHGCGQPTDVTRHTACLQCKHPVLAPELADLRPLLEAAKTWWAAQPQAPGVMASAQAFVAPPRRTAKAWRRATPLETPDERAYWSRLGVLSAASAVCLVLSAWLG